MTKIINIKDAPSGWTRNPNYVYIGRERVIEGIQYLGEWGNPHVINFQCRICSTPGRPVIHERGETIVLYSQWLRDKIMENKDFREAVRNLHGKTLVCFCKPNPCHGDVLVRAADYLQALEEGKDK